MGTLISKRNMKWNNYYNKLRGTDQQTADYLMHLQQQIDTLEITIAKLKEDLHAKAN